MDQSCEVPRWQMLKDQLTNLNASMFRNGFESSAESIILDVRTSHEVNDQKIPGAIHLDYLGYDFIDQLENLDREKAYYVYCRTGRRSVRTCVLMKNWNFKEVYNLEGGLVAWLDSYPNGK
ncbi:MAG: rhodanese-like domain-containing protein [Saprospiraceae bacterium]|nr:rhodanese-like domain-containing protein [Saprospiraceae bacterium]